jgi:hypothetical protein
MNVKSIDLTDYPNLAPRPSDVLQALGPLADTDRLWLRPIDSVSYRCGRLAVFWRLLLSLCGHYADRQSRGESGIALGVSRQAASERFALKDDAAASLSGTRGLMWV